MSILESEAQHYSHSHQLERLIPGQSELAQLMRALDWSKTDLPPPNQWPEELRVAVQLCLSSCMPIVIYWGPEYTVLYNDAYSSLLNTEVHPNALGKKASHCGSDIWQTLEPMLQSVYTTGHALGTQDVPLCFAQQRPLEKVYCRLSLSPILLDFGLQ